MGDRSKTRKKARKIVRKKVPERKIIRQEIR